MTLKTKSSDRIMILDQDIAMGEALAQGLRGCGFHVYVSHEPESILANIRGSDILLTDYHQAGRDGLSVARQAFALGWRGPLLILSGKTTEMKEKPETSFLIKVLDKPYSAHELLNTLYETLNS